MSTSGELYARGVGGSERVSLETGEPTPLMSGFPVSSPEEDFDAGRVCVVVVGKV